MMGFFGRKVDLFHKEGLLFSQKILYLKKIKLELVVFYVQMVIAL